MTKEIRKATVSNADTLKEIARRTIDANYRSFLTDEGVEWFIESGSDQYVEENIDDCWVISNDCQLINSSFNGIWIYTLNNL